MLSSTSAGVAITPDGTKAVVAEATLDVVDIATGAITPHHAIGLRHARR